MFLTGSYRTAFFQSADLPNFQPLSLTSRLNLQDCFCQSCGLIILQASLSGLHALCGWVFTHSGVSPISSLLNCQRVNSLYLYYITKAISIKRSKIWVFRGFYTKKKRVYQTLGEEEPIHKVVAQMDGLGFRHRSKAVGLHTPDPEGHQEITSTEAHLPQSDKPFCLVAFKAFQTLRNQQDMPEIRRRDLLTKWQLKRTVKASDIALRRPACSPRSGRAPSKPSIEVHLHLVRHIL